MCPWCLRAVQDADAKLLYHCLRAIFRQAERFGGSLFALAASVVTDLLHHEPLSYRALQEEGLPDAFVDAIKVRLQITGGVDRCECLRRSWGEGGGVEGGGEKKV